MLYKMMKRIWKINEYRFIIDIISIFFFFELYIFIIYSLIEHKYELDWLIRDLI